MKWLLAASIPILLWVAFGKEVLSAVAYGGTVESVTTEYATPAAGILRTASEVGITVVESVGTVTLLDLQPRFGVDHLLSLLHGDPIGWILHRTGQDEYLPVRIVRLSTEAFATSESQDVPPGIFGQMWVDFRILGPIVWAFLFAAQLSIVKRILELVVRTRQAMAALVLLTFVIALPLNSGSYDFTFSIDIIALSLFLLWTFKIARLELNGTAEGNSASAGS